MSEIKTLQEQLAQMEASHDNQFEFSDDHRVWKKGWLSQEAIYQMRHRIKELEGESEPCFHKT